jgi:U3 small nucleolar ribonucleoprotein component
LCICIGGGGVKIAAANNDRVHPPDKKKFEKETAEITHRIKELEAKLVSFFTKNFNLKY